ncbi:MAG: InlB B-repeat-containing protein [Clostridiales bacterium]|nr:InlB B-repeat-containing protein [Clostridiales bacterium]
MKKVIAVLVSLLFVFGLSGCKDDDEVIAAEDNEITVTFDTRGGDEIDAITCEKNDYIDLPTPVRSLDKFMGWYTDKSWEHKVEDSLRISENTMLYARWAKKLSYEFHLDETNYTKYVDISVSYLYTSETAVSYFQFRCTTKDCVVSYDSGTVYFYVRGYKLDGLSIGGSRQRGFSDVPDVEKTNGVTVYNVSGTLRNAYVLED